MPLRVGTALLGERVVRRAGFGHPAAPGTAPEHVLAPVCVWRGGEGRMVAGEPHPNAGPEMPPLARGCAPAPHPEQRSDRRLRVVEERPRTSPCPGAERRGHVLPCAAGRGRGRCRAVRVRTYGMGCCGAPCGASCANAPKRGALTAAAVRRSCPSCAGAARCGL